MERSQIHQTLNTFSKMIKKAWTYSGTECPSMLLESCVHRGTWTFTWTECPSSVFRQNLSRMARYPNRYIALLSLEGSLVVAQASRMTLPRTFCPSEIGLNARTSAWTKCPCPKY